MHVFKPIIQTSSYKSKNRNVIPDTSQNHQSSECIPGITLRFCQTRQNKHELVCLPFCLPRTIGKAAGPVYSFPAI